MPRKTGKKKKKARTLLGGSRLQEIAGFLLLVLGGILTVSLLTYASSDNALLAGRNVWAMLFPEADMQTANVFGLVGAGLGWILVPKFFGYPSMLLTLLMVVWGYVVMRRKDVRKLIRASIATVAAMIALAVFADWFGHIMEWDSRHWSGAPGAALGNWLRLVVGLWGSLVVTIVGIVTLALLLVDRDVQSILDRAEGMIQVTRRGLSQSTNMLKTWLQSAKKERLAENKTWTELDQSTTNSPTPPPPAVTPRDTPDPIDPIQEDIQPDEPSAVELTIVEQVEEEKVADIARDNETTGDRYTFPTIDLLTAPDADGYKVDVDELESNKRKLLGKLEVYNIEITNINAIVGPTVTLYELTPAPGVKISRIKSLEDDVAMAMAARGIRMIAPIPGKSVVGVEVPNSRRELVRLHAVLATAKFRDAKMELPIVLGKTIEGEVFLQDLTKMPHLLIAGATGSGKSVGINTLIGSLLYACHPDHLKFVMVDPKKIELQQYRALHEHYLALPEGGTEAIITEVDEALHILRSCEREMEERYDLLSDARVRGVKDYNTYLNQGKLNPESGHKPLPYIVIIIDELADLMMTAGKEIEAPIARLAQMARAVGIHLVLATQRPSVDVITGLIKANFPARVAYQVASKIDARTILDQNGAERLVGNGDMLYMSGSRLMRLQGPFVSVSEVDALMDYISAQPGPGPYVLPYVEDAPQGSGSGLARADDSDEQDAFFNEAARIIVRSQQGSVSLLQRKLSIGYTRAARIVDQLEAAGIVGAFVGSKAREVLVADEPSLNKILDE